MAKQAIDAKRKDMFLLAPERLTLVTDKEHPLYDPRVEDAPDESMIANIAMLGVLEPIIVRKNGDMIEVVDGRGRTKATLEVNRRLVAEGKPPIQIPAIVRGGTDADLFGVSISANELRREDTIIHKGEKARKLYDMGYTVQQIAATYGVTRQAVDTWLTVQQMPEMVKEAVQAGDISATAALQVAGLPREQQAERLEAVKKQGVKPTVENMRRAAQAPEVPLMRAPRMRTRREVETELAGRENAATDYTQGFRDALLWVLGME